MSVSIYKYKAVDLVDDPFEPTKIQSKFHFYLRNEKILIIFTHQTFKSSKLIVSNL